MHCDILQTDCFKHDVQNEVPVTLSSKLAPRALFIHVPAYLARAGLIFVLVCPAARGAVAVLAAAVKPLLRQ